MGEEGFSSERLAGRFGQNFIRLSQAGPLVNVGPQPAEQRGEIALTDRRGDLRHGVSRRLKDLRCRHGAQGVGRKVADRAIEPVNVLQATLGIFCWDNAQEFAVQLIPSRW